MQIGSWMPRSKLFAALGAAMLAGQSAGAVAETNFGTLAGSWAGGGQVRLDDGRSERLTCRANYSARGGTGLGFSIRCASPSYKIELRSTLSNQDGRVSGSWEERTFNAAGAIAGRASIGSLNLNFSGSLSGSIAVTYGASSQRVVITSNGGGLRGISLNLSKG